jgi:hypothetical protein
MGAAPNGVCVMARAAFIDKRAPRKYDCERGNNA